MNTFKLLSLFNASVLFLLLSNNLAYAQRDKNCELKANIVIAGSLSNVSEKSATINVESGIAPYKYVFYEEVTGRLLKKDFLKNSADNLKKGNYYCIVIDNKGCTKKIQFQIQ